VSDARVDAFRASVSQGEIRLEFGVQRPEGETVALSHSLGVPAHVALRLLSRLRESLRDAARRAPVSPRQTVSEMGTTLVNAQPDPAAARAAALFRLVGGLGVPFQHERSFRMAQEALLANRVLLSVGRAPLGPDAAARVLDLCRQLGMPRKLHAEVPGLVAGARGLHFGFEAGARGDLYKVYFEREAAQAEAAGGDNVLLHLAYKWDVAQPERCVTTRYLWRPRLDAAALRREMTRAYGAEHAAALECAAAVLDMAAANTDPRGLQFLEVVEDDGARRSFDLNVYDAGLTLRDAQAPLARLRQHFGIRPGQFQALYDQVSAKRLGHIAGGVHRDGGAFATVYYGVESGG
jgi:tryptophan halogenase